jgi:hypothetical protein
MQQYLQRPAPIVVLVCFKQDWEKWMFLLARFAKKAHIKQAMGCRMRALACFVDQGHIRREMG